MQLTEEQIGEWMDSAYPGHTLRDFEVAKAAIGFAAHNAGAQEPVAQWQYRFFDGVKWVDWANCTELLVKHKDGRDDFQFRALFERAHPQPIPQTDSAGAQEPIYQVRRNGMDKWIDVTHEAYELRNYGQYERRIVYTQPQPMTQTDAARDVLAERERQKAVEGWTQEHDDAHEDGDLARAAACYALSAARYDTIHRSNIWPWSREWWKPSSPRRDLVKAAALILAEIERIDCAKGE